MLSNMTSSFTLLFVDDEEDIVNSLYRTFRKGYNVIRCLSGQEAIDIINKTPIDLIISELYDTIIILEADKVLLKNAFLYARLLNISVYDGIYIALSEKFDAPLITADKKLYRSGKNLPYKVIMLSDFLEK